MENATTQTGDGKVHKKSGSQQLQGQAASAALYATNADTQAKNKSILDANNRLSSASAATSLKYAKEQDLPAFPVVGIADPEASAGTAATLANKNQKSFEYWKPEQSGPANKAANLAADYKMAPLWQPEMSAAGSKAALLAAKQGGHVNIWRPQDHAEGNSAAGQAMRNHKQSPPVDYGYTDDGHRRALMAATGAMSGRKRAGSNPISTASYPDSANSASNALNAAAVSHRKSTKGRAPVTDLPGMSEADATRIHDAAVTNLGREMYTSHPPVAPEVEEKNRQAGIRAAAVVMAKQMYAVQQRAAEEAVVGGTSESKYAANKVHRRKSSLSSGSDEPYHAQPQYAHLQEAAQKLAAERLAKLYDENAAYKNYYGTGAPVQSRLSIRGRLRRRASSDSELADPDQVRSQQIKQQMSIFNNKLEQIDRQKQQKDRDALMAAAQRNVQKRMQGIDEKVFADTGKVSPAMMSEWEAKARARAEADSSARMVNYKKVDIGGGKYMDQSEVDAIAAARVQPTLDEITEKAETHRALDEQRRQDEAERKRIAEENARAERERDLKTKEEWKRFKEEEKREEKAKKEQEKARKAEEKHQRDEEKRLWEEEKRKSKSSPVGASVVLAKKTKDAQVEEQAPVLDPLPTIKPISTESIAPATSAEETVPREDIPVVATEKTKPIATEADEPIATETIPAPETDIIIPGNVDHERAEDIVARVFAAPVTTSTDQPPTTSTTHETAPETAAPTSEATRNITSFDAPPKPSTSTEPTSTSTDKTISSTPSKSVSERIAPPPIANEPITKSDIESPKKDEGKKLTSWLKSKLHRGSTKPHEEATKNANESPAATPVTREEMEKLPAGQDQGHGSTADSFAPTSTSGAVAEPNNETSAQREVVSPVDNASTTAQPPMSRSRTSSVSSLSSEESPRGRSGRPALESFVTASDVRVNEVGGVRGTREDDAAARGGSEAEEAKDQPSALPLPPKGSFERNGGGGRESPVGSRFVENL